MKRIVVICGPVCSGKDTMSTKYVEQGYQCISVSDIVRRLTKTTNRTHLKNLSKDIVSELLKFIEKNDTIVVNGPRQMSVVGALWNIVDADVVVGWLEVDREELRRRFLNRASPKDREFTYDEVVDRDSKLGLCKIESYIKARSKTNSKFQIWN